MKTSFRILLSLISGLCFYYGNSLEGNMGWLMWIAPIPVLYISLIVKPREAFLLAFLAFFIGKLSWLSYLLSVLPVPAALLFTVLLPVIYALIVLIARKINLSSPHWLTTLAFPVLFGAYEYLVFLFSPDGTFTAIAYTQSNYLPVIQLAALTGILGIGFVVNLFASLIARAIYENRNTKKSLSLIGASLFLVCLVIGYGRTRLQMAPLGKTIQVGLASIDEKSYQGVYSHDPLKEKTLSDLYLGEISRLAAGGAKIIVLPEKAIIVTDSTRPVILQQFSHLADSLNVRVIVGVTHQKNGYSLNNAWVISDHGKLVMDYSKNNLFEGEILDGVRPGTGTGIFLQDSVHEGVAICKDMDFHQFIMRYSKQSPAILYAPAWDFKKDGWLHARMAILRSVEGGFFLVRNGRDGRLTISDWRGKVLAEANSESGNRTELLGTATIKPHPTTYARTGDGLGTACLFASIGFFLFMYRHRTSAWFAKNAEQEKGKRANRKI